MQFELQNLKNALAIKLVRTLIVTTISESTVMISVDRFELLVVRIVPIPATDLETPLPTNVAFKFL